MPIISAILACILALLSFCADAAEPKPIPNLGVALELRFADEFDGATLDSTKWDFCPEYTRYPINVWDDNMSAVDGEGHLVLRAEWDGMGRVVRSGAVRTKGRFSGGFGYYEASIRLPDATGLWGAFWLMAGDVTDEHYGAQTGVEIDVIESIEGDLGRSNSALHWNGYEDAHQKINKIYPNLNIYDGQFHAFGVLRSPEAYVFYVDGIEVWRVTPDECAICPEPGYMKLSIEAAEWAGAYDDSVRYSLPDEMVVDYVRYWAYPDA